MSALQVRNADVPPTVAPTVATEEVRTKELPEAVKKTEQTLSAHPEQQLVTKVAPEPTTASKTAQTAPTSVSGNKETWLRASGIPEDLWSYVDWLVTRESGWNPCAYNPGKSDCTATPGSACGLVQQYPCGKIPGHWTDPVAALRWQYSYVEKYGGYAGAVNYWKIHGNY